MFQKGLFCVKSEKTSVGRKKLTHFARCVGKA